MSKFQKKAEEYLEKKVRGIIEPMVSQLIIEQPNNPMIYMIEWLQNHQGKNLHKHMNMEKTELNSLRKEMKKYKHLFSNHDQEMNIHTDTEVFHF